MIEPLPADTIQLGSEEPDTTAAETPGTETGSLGGPAGICCPLGFTPETACTTGLQKCALFKDENADERCDNPVQASSPPEDCSHFVRSPDGCPLYLTPEAACPDSMRLCPHWFGRTSGQTCINPTRGILRVSVVFWLTLAMLIGATVLSRRKWGRHRRKTVKRIRMAFMVFSLVVLGFLVQGCFCPLGTSQYLFVAGGASFLGWMGIVLAVLPIVYTLAFGRVFCSWVCPMGALQELLYKIPAPKVPKLPARLDRVLVNLKYVVLAGVVLLPLLVLGGPRGTWPAIFCTVDPFHTIFSLFLVGSLWVAVVLIVVSLLWQRFFCRHFCFYGAVLTLVCRAAHHTGIRKLLRARERPGEESCEIGEED
ncbi:4Fe-4S binding protein [Candidatus Fermentibacterales bacterium]|nr:4Fe-4S binding protein [Candidatus Fermentibacterales bacterium]